MLAGKILEVSKMSRGNFKRYVYPLNWSLDTLGIA